MADGLRRLDGVAHVEVDLQANVCTVTPNADRMPDLRGLPAAVHGAGFRPGRMWLCARGTVRADGRFVIEATTWSLRCDRAPPPGARLVGRLELEPEATVTVEPPPGS